MYHLELQPSDLSSLPDGRSIACPIRMSLYIYFDMIYYLCCMCINFYDLSAWCGCWFIVYIRRFIYKCLNGCPFYYTAVAGSRKVGPVRLGCCLTPYQRLSLYNGAHLVAFYDTLGIRRTYSRLKPPASPRGAVNRLTTRAG